MLLTSWLILAGRFNAVSDGCNSVMKETVASVTMTLCAPPARTEATLLLRAAYPSSSEIDAIRPLILSTPAGVAPSKVVWYGVAMASPLAAFRCHTESWVPCALRSGGVSSPDLLYMRFTRLSLYVGTGGRRFKG